MLGRAQRASETPVPTVPCPFHIPVKGTKGPKGHTFRQGALDRGDDMTSACPRCGFIESELEAAIRRLRDTADLLGIDVRGKIREVNAARLLGRKSAETLRDWRKALCPEDAPIYFYRDGKGNVSYVLEDLAAFEIGLKK